MKEIYGYYGEIPEELKYANSFSIDILSGILKDLTGRRGLRQSWESIDEDIQKEIIVKWYDIINDKLGEWGDEFY